MFVRLLCGAATGLLLVATVVGASAATTLRTSSGGTLFVADSYPGRVVMYPAGVANPAPTGTILKGVYSPYNLALDSAGTLYVQNGDNTIAEYPRGATKPSRVLQLYLPSGVETFVAVGPDGSVYAAARGIIAIYAPGSTGITGLLQVPAGSRGYPALSVCVSPANDVYAIYSRGTQTNEAGVWLFPGAQPPGHDLGITLNYGGSIALDPAGKLLVGDVGLGAINVYNARSGKQLRTIATAPFEPYQVTVDPAGTYLYVAGGTAPGVGAFTYATGAAAWSVTQGLREPGFTMGVAVDAGS
jgi:DNA-binding beta-propeller fold protein YncE